MTVRPAPEPAARPSLPTRALHQPDTSAPTVVGAALGHDWVEAAPFRSHLLHLCHASGLDWRALALTIGLSTHLAGRLLAPSAQRPLRRLPRATALAIIETSEHEVARALTMRADREAVRADLTALARAGHGLADLSLRTGLRHDLLVLLAHGTATSLTRREEVVIRAVCDEISERPALVG